MKTVIVGLITLFLTVNSSGQGLIPYRPTPWTLARDLYYLDLDEKMSTIDRKLDDVLLNQWLAKPAPAPVQNRWVEPVYSPEMKESLRLMDSLSRVLNPAPAQFR